MNRIFRHRRCVRVVTLANVDVTVSRKVSLQVLVKASCGTEILTSNDTGGIEPGDGAARTAG